MVKNVHHRVVREDGELSDVDERVGTRERFGETLAGEHVDAGVAGRGDDLDGRPR